MKVGIQKDLTGQRFEHFVVLGFDYRNKFGKAMWRVKCDCGKEKTVQGNALVSGRSKSCGCAQKEWMTKHIGTGSGDMSGSYWSRLQKNAKSRGHKILITKEQAAKQFVKQNKKCALTGIDLTLNPHDGIVTASLDRIDSTKHYESGNIQWIHKDVNKMKNNLSETVFFNWIKRIYEYQS